MLQVMNKTLIITRLRYFYATNKRLPTYGEMCKLLNYQSEAAVRYVVQKLSEDDVLAKDEQGILIPKHILSIPMLGVIKAGYPMPAEIQVDRNEYPLLIFCENIIFNKFLHDIAN